MLNKNLNIITVLPIIAVRGRQAVKIPKAIEDMNYGNPESNE